MQLPTINSLILSKSCLIRGKICFANHMIASLFGSHCMEPTNKRLYCSLFSGLLYFEVLSIHQGIVNGASPAISFLKEDASLLEHVKHRSKVLTESISNSFTNAFSLAPKSHK